MDPSHDPQRSIERYSAARSSTGFNSGHQRHHAAHRALGILPRRIESGRIEPAQFENVAP